MNFLKSVLFEEEEEFEPIPAEEEEKREVTEQKIAKKESGKQTKKEEADDEEGKEVVEGQEEEKQPLTGGGDEAVKKSSASPQTSEITEEETGSDKKVSSGIPTWAFSSADSCLVRSMAAWQGTAFRTWARYRHRPCSATVLLFRHCVTDPLRFGADACVDMVPGREMP